MYFDIILYVQEKDTNAIYFSLCSYYTPKIVCFYRLIVERQQPQIIN